MFNHYDPTLFFDDNTAVVASQGGIDQYTKLMLHMDGSNGGTTFTDSEITPKTITPTSTTTSTAQVKFGTASGLFNGTTSFLTVDSDFISTGNINSLFSVDFWCFLNSTASRMAVVYQNNGQRAGDLIIDISSASVRAIRYTGTGTNVKFASATATISTGAWHHIYIGWQAGGSIYFALDGVIESIVQSSTTFSVPSSAIRIGNDSQVFYNGYMDELRVSDGINRWTSNFIPPTSAYTT